MKTAHPRIGEFYRDIDFGILKFIGYDDGQYVFHAYHKNDDRWVEVREAVDLSPMAFDAKRATKVLINSLPPE